MWWFACEEECCRLTLEVSFWVKFPSVAAGIALAAGDFVRENSAMTWIGISPSAQNSCYIWAHWELSYQLWKGKLQSFWVQKRMEETLPSSPQGLKGSPGAGMEMQGIPWGGTVLFCPWVTCCPHSPCPPGSSSHSISTPSPDLSSWAAMLLPHLDASLSLLIAILHPSPQLSVFQTQMVCQGARIPWQRWRLVDQWHECLPEQEHLCTSCAWTEGPAPGLECTEDLPCSSTSRFAPPCLSALF